MRKYKIIEEKVPSEDFTRWIPMFTNTITKTGVMVSDQNLWEWKRLPAVGRFNYKSYCETFLEAQEIIDRYENYKKQEEGDFIVNEFEYKPKPKVEPKTPERPKIRIIPETKEPPKGNIRKPKQRR